MPRPPERPGLGSAYSALLGAGASVVLPLALRAPAYRAFARAVGADVSEAELPLDEYPTLGDFFTRRLRPGLRPLDPAPDAILSPCDGVLAARGEVVDGALVQAKGRTYRLAELLASEAAAARFAGGAYATIYLSPKDYHRVHAPVGGALLSYEHVPGALWPVSRRFIEQRDGLLARNERVVIELDAGRLGRVAVVMVAASGVGNLWLTHADPASDGADAGPGGRAHPPRGMSTTRWRGAREPHRVELRGVSVGRGEELGMFRLGSTVVLVFEPGRVALDGAVGDVLRFGARLGRSDAGGGGRA